MKFKKITTAYLSVVWAPTFSPATSCSGLYFVKYNMYYRFFESKNKRRHGNYSVSVGNWQRSKCRWSSLLLVYPTVHCPRVTFPTGIGSSSYIDPLPLIVLAGSFLTPPAVVYHTSFRYCFLTSQSSRVLVITTSMKGQSTEVLVISIAHTKPPARIPNVSGS